MDDQDPNNQVIGIEPEVSKILGLQDDFDLDPEEYLQLIREKLAEYDILSASKKITPKQKEEQRILAPKIREVRQQKRSGEVKYKTGKKINVDSFFGRKSENELGSKNKIISPSKLLPGAGIKSGAIIKQKSQAIDSLKEAKKENIQLVTIREILDSITKTLNDQLKFDQKNAESERKSKEKTDRQKKESDLEKGFSMVKGAVKKMLAPFQNILDQIKRYIFFTFLGKMFTDLMNWLNDPKNKKKVEVLGRFLKDWWPLLLGSYLLFATPLGLFVRGTIKMIRGLTSQIIKFLPRLLKLSKSLVTSKPAQTLANIARSPFVLFPAAVAGTAVLANEITGQRKAASVQAENKARAQTGKGMGVQGVGGVGDIGPTTPYGMLQGIKRGGIIRGYFNGAEIEDGYSGIDSDTGVSISGAGRDTQLIAARPGEVVLTPQDVGHIQQKTGFDVYNFVKNRKPSYTNFSNIKTTEGIPLANKGGILGFKSGGIVGGATKASNPKINLSDYYSLLAISALEDDKPQGRADVAQSLYNRLFAANKYQTNFSQSNNTIKDIIIAPGQYQPTFSNIADWMSIKDKRSAAVAVMNSKKGKDYGWTLTDAMNQLNSTESALKNPALQSAAQKHVGGRPYFLGTSEHGNIKPGDVLRGPTSNFFSSWYLEGTPYDKQRRNVAAPIPQMLLQLQQNQSQQNKKSPSQNIFVSMMSGLGGMFRPPTAAATQRTKKKTSKRWGLDPRGWFGMQGGGLIKENTGFNIMGGTADRQLTALQPGEYVLPLDTVNRLGVPFLNELVKKTDSNSNLAKINTSQNRQRNIRPYSGGSQNMTMLPPIKRSASKAMGASGPISGSHVYSFDPVLSSSYDVRKMNCDIYGIVE